MDLLIYILLALTSVIGLAFIVERAWMLHWGKVVPPQIVAALAVCRTPADVEKLRLACAQKPSPLGRLLLLAANQLDWPKADNVDAVQTAARHEIVRLERGLVVLEIIVGIAPLLGLVGTTDQSDQRPAGRCDGDGHRRRHRARRQADLSEMS